MKMNERMKKGLSMVLCLCMLLQNAPVLAFAATEDNLCEHHPKHTAECGYSEGSAGSACTHEHSEDCYEIVECLHTCGDECGDPCSTHTCTVDNGCITRLQDCRHTHGDCGYVAAVEGHACHYACSVCAIAPVSDEPGDEAPAEPDCYCAEKCTAEVFNEYCEVCGVDYASCTGTDMAVQYAEGDAVAKVEDTEYADINEALANWTDGTTLTLLSDVTNVWEIKISDKSVTFDLNGHTFSGEYCLFNVEEDGSLVITDSSSEGDGLIESKDDDTVFSRGHLTFAGGTATSAAESHSPIFISAGSFQMTGGTAKHTAGTSVELCGEAAGTIRGGSIISGGVHAILSWGVLTISDSPAIHCENGYSIAFGGSDIDLSGADVASADGWTIWNVTGETVTVGTALRLPNHTELLVKGNPVTEWEPDCVGVISHTHTGDTQTCRGYFCTACENWYGEKSKTNHDESVVYSEADNGFCPHCSAYQPAELKDGCYEISNAGQLYWFAAYGTNANAILKNNIVVNQNVLNEDGTLSADSANFRSWKPIHWYSGTFDGQNHTISGLYFNDSNAENVGLFGTIDGTVRNVGIVDSYFYGNWVIGGVVGNNQGGTVTGCYHTGTVRGNEIIGGVVGYNQGGTVTNCYNTGRGIGGMTVGGVVSINSEGTVTNCYNTGWVESIDVGSLVSLNGGTVSNCYYNSGTGIGSQQDGIVTNVLHKTEAQFASGEVAYLLGEAFGQNLGTENYPVLGGEEVYCGYNSCEDTEMCYSNSEFTKTTPGHEWSYTDNQDGQTHTQACSACTYEEKAVDHSFDSSTGACVECKTDMAEAASVTIGGTTAYYQTLDAAITAVANCTAEDAAVVKLLDDVDLGNNNLKITSGVFTIDLGGKTVTGEGDHTFWINGSGANVTFDNGSIEAVWRCVFVSTGTANILKVSMSVTDERGVAAYINSGMNPQSPGKLYIDGATITSAGLGVGSWYNGASVEIKNSSIIGEVEDIEKIDATLTVGENVTFPGGLTVLKGTLNEYLAEGYAYWQDGKMLTVADDATSIDGDVTVKAECKHGSYTLSDYKPTDDGKKHTAIRSCCGTEVTEAHTPDDSKGHTCMGRWCTDCESWYGAGNGDNHLQIGDCDCGLTTYPIWVMGCQVTSADLDFVGGLVNVSYNPGENILYLGRNIGDPDAEIVALKVDGDITVNVSGDKTVYGMIDVTGSLTITGEGSMTVDGHAYGIQAASVAFGDDAHVIIKGDQAVKADAVTGKGYCRTAADEGFIPFVAPGSESYYEVASKMVPIATVTIGESTTYFRTLDDAVTKAAEGTEAAPATLKLEQDINLINNYQEIQSGVFTLDLNGRTLQGSGDRVLEIRGTETLKPDVTITDGSDADTGTISCTGDPSTDVLRVSDSTVTINGGTISGSWNGVNASGSTVKITGGTIDCGWGVGASDSTVEITGGTMLCSWNGVDATGSAVTISGGTITGDTYDIEINSDIDANDSTIILDLGEGGIGATFPGGLTVEGTTLNAILAKGAAYWQDTRMLTYIVDDETEIIGGNVTVKAPCDHAEATYPADGITDNWHTLSCPCGYEATRSHSTEKDENKATCNRGKICDLCGEIYGEADPNAHTGTLGAPVSTDGGKHVATYSCCSTPVTEDHSLSYRASGSTITATCSANCGYSATAAISAENATYDGAAKETATVTCSEGWPGGEMTVSYENNVNAGTATASIKLGEAEAKVSFTIIPASLAAAEITTATGITYTGSAIEPDVIVKLGEKTLTGADYDVTYANNQNVGTATVTITGKGNYKDSASITFTIVKAAAPAIQWPTAAELTYGQKLSDSALTGSDGNGSFAWQDGNTVPTVSNDGYVVVYTPKDVNNYDYTGVTLTKTISVTVSKAAASVTAAPTAKELTYTGENQELITEGTAKGGTMQYQLNNGAWSANIPAAKDEGTYTVSYKVVGDANHSDTEVKSLTVTIGDCTHSGNTNVDDADCTTAVTCSVCGDVLAAAKTHVWGDWTTTKAPTTTAAGSKERPCTNDGCLVKDTDSIPMLNEVEISKPEGGDVTVDNASPATGEDVTITVTPEPGKEVEDITVTDKDGNEIPVTENEDGTYTYEQPEGDVTVEVMLKDTIYTVIWTVDGTTYKEIRHKFGETIVAPAEPAKAQSGCTTYAFEKWNGFTAGMQMPDNHNLIFAAVFTEGESHIDENTDHSCDRSCGKQDMGDHADENKDHACDYGCDTAIGEHKDADKDHACDYGCKVTIGTHEDTNKDHTCDYGCSETIGICADADKDHACDYGCDKVYGEHVDADRNHACDYGCDKVYSEHNFATEVEGSEIPATCTAEGTVTMKCDCGATEVKTLPIDPDNHIPDKAVEENRVESTCTVAGSYDEVVYCSAAACKHEISRTPKTLPLAEHTYGDLIPAQDAVHTQTELKAGVAAHYICGVCDTYFTSGKTETTLEELTGEIPAHSYVKVVTVPTCTEKGYTTYTCSCGDSYVSDYVDALDHEYANGICTRCGAAFQNPFIDVLEGSFYYDAVMWAVKVGITNGYGDGNIFAPDVDCTRGQIVTFLWRAAGCPAPKSDAMPFRDVDDGEFYTTAVLWAVENGVTNGYGAADIFAPDMICTRGQIVTMLNRYLGGKATSDANPFVDVEKGAFYYDAVLWAAENGITNGMGEGTFAPDADCTRAQVVTFLYRAYSN